MIWPQCFHLEYSACCSLQPRQDRRRKNHCDMRLFQFLQPAKHLSVMTALVTLVTFSLYAVPNPAGSDPASTYAKSSGATPDQVIEHFMAREPNTGSDHFTLATAYYAKFNFVRALDSANRALSTAPDETAKSVCSQLVAQCHGALGHYTLAQEAAISGSRYNPRSAELAALRIAYARLDGDAIAEAAASEHLMQIDPNYAKSPKCDPVTAGVIIVAIVCAAYTSVAKIAADAKDPVVGKVIADSLSDLLRIAFPANLMKKFVPVSTSK